MIQHIATNKEQSDRLLKCRVPYECADFARYEDDSCSMMEWDWTTGSYGGTFPAWSLSALLTNVLPSKIVKKNEYHIWFTYKLKITTENSEWYAVYESCEDSIDLGQSIIEGLFSTEATDPIEACVLMAEKLHANGYKLNEIREK